VIFVLVELLNVIIPSFKPIQANQGYFGA